MCVSWIKCYWLQSLVRQYSFIEMNFPRMRIKSYELNFVVAPIFDYQAVKPPRAAVNDPTDTTASDYCKGVFVIRYSNKVLKSIKRLSLQDS